MYIVIYFLKYFFIYLFLFLFFLYILYISHIYTNTGKSLPSMSTCNLTLLV